MWDSICQQISTTQQWTQEQKRSAFIPIPKKGNAKECSNYHTIAHISHASKVMLKFLQARLLQYMNNELPDVQARFRKDRGTRDQISTSIGSQKRQENFLKVYVSIIEYAWAFDCVDHNKLWKILQKMVIPDHLTCSLKHLYSGQKATVRNRHGIIHWFQLGKGKHQGCIL